MIQKDIKIMTQEKDLNSDSGRDLNDEKINEKGHDCLVARGVVCLSEVREFHSTSLLMMIQGEQRGTGAGTGGTSSSSRPTR